MGDSIDLDELAVTVPAEAWVRAAADYREAFRRVALLESFVDQLRSTLEDELIDDREWDEQT
jgi:hypothetical protein